MDEVCPLAPPNAEPQKNPHQPYDPDKAMAIRCLYILGILMWIGIIALFGLATRDPITWVILAIPILVYVSGYIGASYVTAAVEVEVFRANYLSIGLLIALPLLTWINKEFTGDRRQFSSILIAALILTMFSMMDLWVKYNWLSVMKHGKSILQTASLTLLVYALYSYYVAVPHIPPT